jgi:hypothetical protein
MQQRQLQGDRAVPAGGGGADGHQEACVAQPLAYAVLVGRMASRQLLLLAHLTGGACLSVEIPRPAPPHPTLVISAPRPAPTSSAPSLVAVCAEQREATLYEMLMMRTQDAMSGKVRESQSAEIMASSI